MKIKDPVHGYIELNEEEKRLIDLPEIQRLRRIKQLGFSTIVYPSATHTRFQHTLGVMKTVKDYAEALDLDKKRTRELRVAALFHDSGHGPWSHLSEKILDFDHEEISCKVARRHEDKYSSDSQRVTKIIKGELEIGKVLHGDVDADRLDYLQRDAYNTGVEHGMIDSGTIVKNAEIDSRRVVYDEKATQALESLLVARMHMIKSVYQHHAVKIADRMIEEAVKNQDLSVFNFRFLDDYQADRLMYDNDFYEKVMGRELYKRAGTFGNEHNITKEKLVEESGVEEDKILVDRSGYGAENPKRESSSLDIKIKTNEGVRNLRKESKIPEAVFENLIGGVHKVYSSPETKKKIKNACEKLKL